MKQPNQVVLAGVIDTATPVLKQQRQVRFNVMHGLPITAPVSEVLSLFQQCLYRGTANTGVAVSVYALGEPCAGNARLGGVAALHHAVVSLTPFLHHLHGMPVSTSVLFLVGRRR